MTVSEHKVGDATRFSAAALYALGIERTRPMGWEVAAEAMPGVTDGGVELVPVVQEHRNPLVRRSPW